MAVITPCHDADAQTKGGPTPAPAAAAVYFIGIKDGDTLPSKPTIHFGLRNMSVAPAGIGRENTGHHHLIIDASLPPLDQPIPNDLNHLHFGAGQSEADVTLPPGRHTLQLLLGDKDHIPHTPPLFSERITVNVVKHTAPANAEVYFENLTDGQYMPPRMIVRFGLLNMGVAPAGVDKPNTGHHHLIIDAPTPSADAPIPNDFNHLHFGAGQTQAEVTLPPGRHSLQLVLGDEDHVLHYPPVMSKRITVIVAPPDERPVLRRGASGPAVTAIQAKLGVLGNGTFDAATEQAVLEFQDRADLDADAIVGPQTWKALDALSGSRTR
ncbi:MAG: DUF4399 domain-containing protein [Xanthobacteraceae bacterium]